MRLSVSVMPAYALLFRVATFVRGNICILATTRHCENKCKGLRNPRDHWGGRYGPVGHTSSAKPSTLHEDGKSAALSRLNAGGV